MQTKEMEKGYSQVARTVFGAKASDVNENVNYGGSAKQTSGANKPTMGEATISSKEAEIIREEVRSTMRKVFPRINLSTAQRAFPVVESGRNETGKPEASVIDLLGSTQKSVPLAIAGSDVSVASTSSNLGQERNASFSRMLLGTDTTSHPQMFATMQWKPKEPPCFYGRSSEDVHTWTSLVRHYLTFMGGSDGTIGCVCCDTLA